MLLRRDPNTAEPVAEATLRSPSETAPDFIDSRARCGVIVIWTRRWLASDLTGP